MPVLVKPCGIIKRAHKFKVRLFPTASTENRSWLSQPAHRCLLLLCPESKFDGNESVPRLYSSCARPAEPRFQQDEMTRADFLTPMNIISGLFRLANLVMTVL